MKKILFFFLLFFGVNSFAFFDKKIFILDQNIVNNSYDFNNADANKFFWTQNDLNAVLQIPDFNSVWASIAWVQSQGYASSLSDTNWQTGFYLLDANLALSYYKQTDLNNNNLFSKVTDANAATNLRARITDVNGADVLRALITDVNAADNLRALITDVNAADALRILLVDTNKTGRINYLAIADINKAFFTQIDANLLFAKITDINAAMDLRAKTTDINGTYSKITDVNASLNLKANILDVNGADTLRALISDVNGADLLRLLISDLNDTGLINSKAIADLNKEVYTQKDLNNNNLFIKASDSNNTSRLNYLVIANAPWLTSFTELDPLSIPTGSNIWSLVLPTDFNNLYKNVSETDPISIHTTDSNNIGRLDYQVIANPPWLTSFVETDPFFFSRFTSNFDGNFYGLFKGQFDNNFFTGFQTNFDSNFAASIANKMPIADANILNVSWSKLLSVPTAFPHARVADANLTTDLNATFAKISDTNAAITLRARTTDVNGADSLRALINDVNGADALRILIADSNNTSRLHSQVIASPPWAVIGSTSIWGLVLPADWNQTFARHLDINGIYSKILDVNGNFAKTTDMNAAIALRARITDVNAAIDLRAKTTDINGTYSKTVDVNAADLLRALITDVNGADNLRAKTTDINGTYLNQIIGGTISGDTNVTTGINKGVNIKSDLNRICFPSNSCEMNIDFNGTAIIIGS